MVSEKLSILTDVLGKHRKVGGNFSFNCPNKEHSDHKGGDIDYKLNVNLRNNLFKCWVCGYHGHVVSLLKDYGKSYISEFLSYDSDDDYVQKKAKSVLPKDFNSNISDYPDFLKNRLNERKISDECASYYKIGFSNEKFLSGKPILPSLGVDGLDFYTIDNIGMKPKYMFPSSWDYSTSSFLTIPKNEYIMNFGNINPHIPLIVVEGFYNAISFYPYTNVTWLNGKEFYENFENFVTKNNIPTFIWLDDELQSNKNSANFIKKMKSNGLYSKRIGNYKYKDPNDFLKNGEYELLESIIIKEIIKWENK